MMITKGKTNSPEKTFGFWGPRTPKKTFGFWGQRINKAAVVALALVVAAVILPGVSQAAEEDIIVFPDSDLKSALVSLPGADVNADKELTEGELAALTGRLDVINLGVKDITGMQFASGLSELNLSGNKIRDISCLASLVASSQHNLTALDISQNYLDLTAGSDDMAVINHLISAGCAVIYEPQKTIAVEEVTFDKTILEMCIGDTVTLNVNIYPDDAADKTIFWLLDNEDAVSVTAEGVVSAKATGTANITVTSNDGITAVCAVMVKDGKLSSSKYTIADGYVTNVGKSTVVDVFKSYFSNDYGDLRVFNANGEAHDKGIIGSGMTVKLFIGDVPRDEAVILVGGDVNGDGFITISDYTLTRLDMLGLQLLEGSMRTAADINGDGNISISDYTLSRLDMLGLRPICTLLPDLPEVTDTRIRRFLDIALAQIGKPYVFGAEGPDSFDCSGFIHYSLNQAGYSVGRSTADTYSKKSQWLYVDKGELQPGDLMFYWSDTKPGVIGHVGIYLGNGYHIHASSDYMHIVICRVNGWYDEALSHGRRVFN